MKIYLVFFHGIDDGKKFTNFLCAYRQREFAELRVKLENERVKERPEDERPHFMWHEIPLRDD
jgi:hypothetical protein